MNTIRKLNNEDVRAIFESLHDKKPPPPGLKFQIVPVGPEGLRLSPPTYAFDGTFCIDICGLLRTNNIYYRLILYLSLLDMPWLFIDRDRWNLRLAQAWQKEKSEETRRKSRDSSASSPFRNGKSAIREMSMESFWTAISQANGDPTKILLPERESRLRIAKRRSALDYVLSWRRWGWRVPFTTRLFFGETSCKQGY